ncbi:2-ketogluconate reductase [Hyaloscypha sp. PMI_1271]|nr:2-ketogluconate reductase [Hyaloscypha sp. PMI_1271]
MPKPTILHIGNPSNTTRNFTRESSSPDSMSSKARRRIGYGDFSAIYGPHFQTGGEMGQWDAELIPLPPSVRIFASAGAGFNWADTDLLGQHKIWYANGAGASDEAVSDTAFYMIVSVFCSFTRSQLPTRTTVLEIFNVTHKLIASISHNPRGKKLAYKARMALGMEIHCFDVVRASVDEEHRLGATFHASLDKLLKVAECISIHTPLNAHPQDLIDARALALMKPGSRVVNTARGQVVNEDALVAALKSGHISAAGLYVYYHELQVAPELAEMENATLTAHIGGGALDTRINSEPNAMKNILAVVGPDGEFIGEPLTPVNAKAFNAP